MDLADVLAEQMVRLQLKGVSREEVIEELVGVIAGGGHIKTEDVTRVVTVVRERERLGSSTIGRGLALLHAELPSVSGCVVAVGRSTGGVSLHSLDGEPSHLVFLILSHPDSQETYLSVLEGLSRLFSKKDVREQILAAKDANELLEVIMEREPS